MFPKQSVDKKYKKLFIDNKFLAGLSVSETYNSE